MSAPKTAAEAAQERAATLLETPAAQGRPDFAARAAACYLLAGQTVDGFDGYRVWPGAIEDFSPTHPAENARLAAAILAIARDRPRAAA